MSSLEHIREFLDSHSGHAVPTTLMLRRCMSEAWFSDTLAWLLDPKGCHGVGVQFLQEFVKAVANERGNGNYARRATHLKYGKGGLGCGATTFNLGNAAVMREFFLARSVGRNGLSGSRYCDVVVLDFDTTDAFFMVIENKLFTVNAPGQLREYLETVETRYDRASLREYVYLTLDGHEPVPYDDDPKILERWVRLSWTKDVLDILDRFEGELSMEAQEVRVLLRCLKRLVDINQSVQITRADVTEFRGLILHAVAECLHEELQRLGENKRGDWRIESQANRIVRLVHSSAPMQSLNVEMLPTFCVAVQTRYRQRGRYEKIIFPFGSAPDQVFNMLDVSARDIYRQHFAIPDAYLGDKRRLRKTTTPMKDKHRRLFEFLHHRRFEVQILLTTERSIWKAAQVECLEDVGVSVDHGLDPITDDAPCVDGDEQAGHQDE